MKPALPRAMQQRAHTESNLANLLIGELAGDQTAPQMLVSTPYERVDIVEAPPEQRQTRRRAATIPREDLVRRAQIRDDAFDAASTLQFSAPYARIEVGELESIVRASGSFEAWFKDDVQPEPIESPEDSDRWLWFLAAAMLAAFAVTVVALI